MSGGRDEPEEREEVKLKGGRERKRRKLRNTFAWWLWRFKYHIPTL